MNSTLIEIIYDFQSNMFQHYGTILLKSSNRVSIVQIQNRHTGTIIQKRGNNVPARDVRIGG